jgi:hypothetical protein
MVCQWCRRLGVNSDNDLMPETKISSTLPEIESSPWVRSFAESQNTSSRWSLSSPRAHGMALGEGLAHGEETLLRELSAFSCRRDQRNRNGRLRPLHSPSARHTWLSAKKTHGAGALPPRALHLRWVFCVHSRRIIQKKLHIFESKLFPWSTYTHIMYMFKIGTILSLFAIFTNFTSFFVFVSYTSDMKCKCIKS